MVMDGRKFRILQAIIDDYILTAIPVGSRTISKKYDMGLSSATIRNEMSDLEELGYLDQPHVSAGRIPSAKAYRLYVDQLLSNGVIKTSDTKSVYHYFDNRARQMEDVIAHAANVISGITHYTSLVLSPQGAELRIRNIQLVAVNATSALVVIVTDSNILRDAVIRISPDLDSDALYQISRMMTEKLTGMTLSEALKVLQSMISAQAGDQDIAKGVLQFVSDVEKQGSKTKLALGGTSNILNFPEYNDIEKAKSFLSVLETKEQLVSLLRSQDEMAFTVRIGKETGIKGLESCSLVTATYCIGDHSHGTLGVIGPTRMHYGKVISVLSEMGQQLSYLLSQEKE